MGSLRFGLLIGLGWLCACTLSLELAEPQYASGDLAASSMGLAAHDPWFSSPDERARVRLPQGDQVGRSASHPVAAHPRAWARGYGRDDLEEPVVPSAPDLSLASSPDPPGRGPETVGADGLVPGDLQIIPARYALAGEPSGGPAPDLEKRPLAAELSASPPEPEAIALPPPAPPKPFWRPDRVWIPKMKPSTIAARSGDLDGAGTAFG